MSKGRPKGVVMPDTLRRIRIALSMRSAGKTLEQIGAAIYCSQQRSFQLIKLGQREFPMVYAECIREHAEATAKKPVPRIVQ
jgi:hypothetical protein